MAKRTVWVLEGCISYEPGEVISVHASPETPERLKEEHAAARKQGKHPAFDYLAVYEVPFED